MYYFLDVHHNQNTNYDITNTSENFGASFSKNKAS